MSDLKDFSQELDKSTPGWRDSYQNWRKGGTKGAKGEIGEDIVEPLLTPSNRGYSTGQMDRHHYNPDAFLCAMAKVMSFKDAGGQTHWEAVMNILNNCTGISMLGVSWAISRTGLLVGLVVMTCSALVNSYTLLLHQKTCKLVNCSSGGTELAEAMLGKAGQGFMVGLLTVFGFFCMVALIVGATDSFTGMLELFLSDDAMPSNRTAMIITSVLFLTPPTFIRSFKNIAVLSAVAFVACGTLAVMLVLSCASKLAHKGMPGIDDLKWFPDDYPSLMQGLPTMLLMFSIQACGAVVLATMADTSMRAMTKVTVHSYVMVYTLNCIVGGIVYLTFIEKTEKDAIKNLKLPPPMMPSHIMGAIAVVALFILVDLSYMLMIIPCKIALLDMIFGMKEERMEASAAQFYGTTVVLNMGALVFTLLVSDLSIILRINGAIFTNILAFIMPPMLFMMARARPAQDQTPVKYASLQNLPYMVICAAGCCMLVLGSIQIVSDML